MVTEEKGERQKRQRGKGARERERVSNKQRKLTYRKFGKRKNQTGNHAHIHTLRIKKVICMIKMQVCG